MNEILQQTNSLGKAFVEFAGPMLIQSSVLILILLLADLLVRKRVRAVFRYWMWMLVLVKLVLPTSLSLPMSFGYWFGDNLRLVKPHQRGEAEHTTQIPQVSPMPTPTQATPFERIGAGPTEPAPMPRPELAPVEPIPAEPVSSPAALPTPLAWQGALFLVWLAVVIVMSLLLLQRAIFVRGLIAQAEEATGLMKDTLHYCCQQIAIKRKVSLKISPNASSPAVCGLFRPVILVPQNLASSLGSNRLRVVLMHELAHIRRADLWVNLAQAFLQIVYFYNPLLWLANAIIRRVREQAVDEAVLVAMGEKAQQYPQTLLDVAKSAFKRPTLSLRLIGVVESKSALASRIKHILNRPVPKTGKLGVLGLIAIMITAAVLLPMAKSVNKSDVTAAGKNTEIVVVRWMAVLEQAAGRDVLAISGAEKTSSESYEGFICNSEYLSRAMSQNLRNGKVIHISNNLTWLEPSPEYQRADTWADSANLAHPLYKGYTSGGAGLYKLGTTEWTAKLDLRYESVTCLLNPGPRISGKIFFQGDAIPGHALVFLGSLKENERAQARHLVVWQTVKAPSRLVPYIKAIYSTKDWIQMGPIGILKLAEEGFGRNKNLPVPATSSDKWTHTLPDGSKVRLVAVFRPKDNPFLFWDPDGKPVCGLPQWHNRDVAGHELAVVFERPQRIKGENPASDGRFYSPYVPVAGREIDSSKPVVACYGRGYGDWQEIGGLHEGLEISHLGQPYTLAKVEDRTLGERKQILVTMWYSVNPDIGIRLVAVDKKGRKYPMESADTWIGTPAKGHRTQYYEFAIGLSKEDLSHFILQKRPIAWARFSDFATKPKEQPPVETNRSVSATLPNGVTVELIGICEHPSEGKQWWGLDGQSIAKPYERLTYTESSREYKRYEIAYRLFGSEDIASTIYSNAAVVGNAGPYRLSQKAKDLNIQDADNAYGAILLVKSDAQSIALEIGAGRESDWKTLCTQGSPVDKTGTVGPGVVFQPAIEKDSKTYVTIAHQIKDHQIRVVAIDHSGQLHKPEGFLNDRTDELGSCQARFDLPTDQIKEIQFQTQKFQRITFKNVSLQPGVKTDVQIEVEKADVLPEPVVLSWEDVGKPIPPDFNDTMALAEHVTLTGIGQDAEGKTFVTCIRDAKKTENHQYRFVLVQKDESVLEPSGYGTFGPSEKLQEKFSFDTPYVARQMKGFRFQSRLLHAAEGGIFMTPGAGNFGIQNSQVKILNLAPPGRCALSFDGVDDYLLVPFNPSLTFEPPFTVEMWIKPEFPKEQLGRRPSWGLLAQGCYTGTGRVKTKGFGIRLERLPDHPGSLHINYCTANERGIYETTYGTDHFDDWMHISHVFRNENYEPAYGHPLVVGKFLIPSENAFKGQIGEIRIWNCARSRQEIERYKNVALTGTEPNLAACWTFEQSDSSDGSNGQFTYDISAGGNHARLGFAPGPDKAEPKWVESKDYSSEPGVRTDVQIEAEKTDVQVEREEVWGEAVEGVQVRLWVEKKIWRVDEEVILRADVRNQGKRDLMLDERTGCFDVWVDAFPYSPDRNTIYLVWPAPFGPGQHYNGRPIALRRYPGLKLALGKHTIRVVLKARQNTTLGPALPLGAWEAGEGDWVLKENYQPPVVASSNPVEIEIVAAQEKTDVPAETDGVSVEATPFLKKYEADGFEFEAGFVPDKTEYVWTEPMYYFTYVVKNTGNKTLSFKEGGDYRGGRSENHKITAVDANDKPVPVPEMWDMGGIVQVKKLEPGEVYTKMLPISRRLTFSGPGVYTVTGQRTLVLTESLDTMFDEQKNLKIPTGNSFQLTIHPYSKERMANVIESLAAQIWNAGNLTPQPVEYTEPTEMSKANRLHLALSSLTQIKDEAALGHLITMAKTGPPNLRIAAVKRLGEFTDDKVMNVVLETLGDEDETICAAAYEALATMKTDAAIDILIARLPQAQPQVTPAILHAMGRTKSPRVFDLIVESLRHKDTIRRRAAVNGLVAFGGDDAVEALKTCVDDDDMDFREFVVGQLAKSLKQPIDAQWLVPVIWARKNTDTLGDAPRLLRLYAGERAVPALLSCLDYENPSIRGYYNWALIYDQGWCQRGLKIPWCSDLNRDDTPGEVEQNRTILQKIRAWVEHYYKYRMDEKSLPQHLYWQEQDKYWGEPVDGISIRARINQRVWPGGIPQLVMIDVRGHPNEGSVNLSSVPQPLEVEINADWYVRQPPLQEPTMGISAGHGSSFHNLLLNENWRRISDNQPLQLRPGKYTLRIRLSTRTEKQRTGLATSKPIQFEIIEAD
jgi:beta-lactamase regulating signal transducer with metallopeptidase domain